MAPTERSTQEADDRRQGKAGLISRKGWEQSIAELCRAENPSLNCYESPLWHQQLTWYQRAVLWILRQGALPRHVIILPDGNRRFAKNAGIETTAAYDILFENLTLVWNWMTFLGVTRVSCPVFGMCNFRRNDFDIEAILSAIVRFFTRTLDSLNLLQRTGLQLHVVGEAHLLPKEMQAKLAQVEVLTSVGSGVRKGWLLVADSTTLNRVHMAHDLAKAVKTGALNSEDITAQLIEDYLDMFEAPEMQLWFRSTGAQRFTECMTFQCAYAYMHPHSNAWPSVQLWDWVLAVVKFQLYWPAIRAVKEKHRNLQNSGKDRLDSCEAVLRQRVFLMHVEMVKTALLHGRCSESQKSDSSPKPSRSSGKRLLSDA